MPRAEELVQHPQRPGGECGRSGMVGRVSRLLIPRKSGGKVAGTLEESRIPAQAQAPALSSFLSHHHRGEDAGFCG